MTRSRILLAAAPIAASILGLALWAGTAQSQPASSQDACPPWASSHDLHSNAEAPNLGCVNRKNLGKMLAHPEDLAQGRSLGPADGARESRAVDAYQQGKVKPFGTDQSMAPAIIVPGMSASTP